MTPFIVAEISCNHLGSLDRALELVEAAARAGADGVKFQTFDPEQMAPPDYVLEDGPWAGRNLRDLYREAVTPREWHAALFDLTRARGIVPFSSPFHPDDVAFLETLDCPIYKIASFEILNLPLIGCTARTGKPLIISTGMATGPEIETAVRTAMLNGNHDVTLLACTSAYPTPAAGVNLRRLWAIERFTSQPVGLSDHTLGSTAAIAATALGATVIEKHLTLRRSDGGPDAGFSAEPEEFADMVMACRQVVEMMGNGELGPHPSEASSLKLRRQPGKRRGE
jgi:sialic acid synthase SpsE